MQGKISRIVSKGASVKRAVIFTAILLFFISVLFVFAQENKIDLNALLQETQKKSDKADEMTFVWWIPEEYWQASFAQNPDMNAAKAEEIIKVFRPYTILAVVDGKMNGFGAVNYKTEPDIRGIIRLKDNQGNVYLALEETDISIDTRNFLAMMRPVLANILGPMGQNMYFFVFPAKGKNGRMISDAKQAGGFSVVMGEKEFRWKLPLGSVLLTKICPVCKEKLSGAYKYCPWDGTPLP